MSFWWPETIFRASAEGSPTPAASVFSGVEATGGPDHDHFPQQVRRA